MNVYEFIKELRKQRLYTVKQSMYVENIFIYVEDSEVYKIILQVDPAMIKKAKKIRLNNEYVIHNLKQKVQLEDKFKKGRYIIIYDTRKDNADVYGGEITEKEQYERLKS